jgi:hypothetical protein
VKRINIFYKIFKKKPGKPARKGAPDAELVRPGVPKGAWSRLSGLAAVCFEEKIHHEAEKAGEEGVVIVSIKILYYI